MHCRLARLVVLLMSFCGIILAANSTSVWLDVPFVKQENKNDCGAASISMVMQYWLRQQGSAVSQTADATIIHKALYVPGSEGIHASDMERYFQEQGFRTFAFKGEWEVLHQHLLKGRPLIVAVNPKRADSTLHYLVVAGIDTKNGLVLVNDSARRKLLKQDRSSFEKQWSATDKWTLLALPQPKDGD